MDPPELEFISGKDFKRNRFLKVDQKGPHGLVIEGNIAYVACDDATMVTIDLESTKLVSRAKLAGPPDVLWYNKKQNLVYCSIGDPGVVQVFDGKTLEMVHQVETEYGSHTLTFDENMQKLYTLLPESHYMAFIRLNPYGTHIPQKFIFKNMQLVTLDQIDRLTEIEYDMLLNFNEFAVCPFRQIIHKHSFCGQF